MRNVVHNMLAEAFKVLENLLVDENYRNKEFEQMKEEKYDCWEKWSCTRWRKRNL